MIIESFSNITEYVINVDHHHCQYEYHPGTERIVQRELDCDGQHGDDQVSRRDGRSFAGPPGDDRAIGNGIGGGGGGGHSCGSFGGHVVVVG